MRLFQHDLEEALSIMNIQIGFSIHFDIIYIYIYTHTKLNLKLNGWYLKIEID